MAYGGLPFVRKLSFILFKKLQFLDAGMALSYAGSIQRKLSIFFLFKSAVCQLVALCSFTIVPYTMVLISRDAVLGSSLIFLHNIVSLITLSSRRSY